MKTSKNEIIARDFLSRARDGFWNVRTRGSIVTIEKDILVGNAEAFADAEMDSSILLGMIPVTSPGSTWGTDGASVGGHVAMTTGHFVMNKSGCSKNVIKQINKILKGETQ